MIKLALFVNQLKYNKLIDNLPRTQIILYYIALIKCTFGLVINLVK